MWWTMAALAQEPTPDPPSAPEAAGDEAPPAPVVDPAVPLAVPFEEPAPPAEAPPAPAPPPTAATVTVIRERQLGNAWSVASMTEDHARLQRMRADLAPLRRKHVPWVIGSYATGTGVGLGLMATGALGMALGALGANDGLLIGGGVVFLLGPPVIAGGAALGTTHLVRYQRAKSKQLRLQNYYSPEEIADLQRTPLRASVQVGPGGLVVVGTF